MIIIDIYSYFELVCSIKLMYNYYKINDIQKYNLLYRSACLREL